MVYTTLWLIVCGAFLITEVFTVGFLLFFPGVGAFFAFIAALFNLSFFTQIVIFAISTILMIIFVRPLVTKFFKIKQSTPMNSDSLIGKTGITLKDIEGDKRGQIKVAGEIWSATCNEGEEIIKDTEVVVKEIKGVKLFVEKK